MTTNKLYNFGLIKLTPDNPPDVYSTGRYMWVKFYSSSYGPVRTENDKGFKAHFEALDPPGKNPTVYFSK